MEDRAHRRAKKRTKKTSHANRQRAGLLPGRAIAAFVAIALLSIGIYAAWRHHGNTSTKDEVEQGATNASQVQDDPRTQRLLADLTLEQKVAQLFVVRPEAITGVDVVVAAGDATRKAITNYPVGGICYFADNLVSPEQTQTMLRNVQNYAKDACGLPLFTCVDEEGGTVVRVADNSAFGVENVGDMASIGATEDVEQARGAALTMGRYLSDLGFNVDFAPVADISTSEDGTMDSRSFGDTPEKVAPMVAAQVDGFAQAGILCAAKHFPGIGGAEGDSHNGRIYSSRTADEMAAWDLVPFEAAIEADVPMIMVGHLSCLELGRGEGDLPASLSGAVIEGLLRSELGYDGIVITDSLEMGAVTEVCSPDDQAVLAIKAGADLVLMPQDFERAYRGLLKAVRDGDIDEARIDESLRRIIRAKTALEQ